MFARNKRKAVSVSSDMMSKQKRYEALVNATHADLYRYAYWLIRDKSIAEGVVQETYLRAWKSLDSLQDQKAAKSWLITILRRENARRFERKQFDLVDIDEVSIEDTQHGNETELEHAELRKLMAGLNDEYREPLMLQIIFGYSGEEIAQQLDLNKNTVMTRLFRARNQLKEALEASYERRQQTNG
ncbi:sigma-70 family RNA polymerase sigma factor [Alteromonas sp. ASW11-36]|uniref:Sigma-70 family RNA polymerase sigma factor n=1 Tax=Alteromonas arenosi TaxID=3055817 RepID=A0ABT7SUY9_9ALTE|nr:sigma-70 family RNA polymerase sigma factor [Alteromonas sp. ASW11-36]MDM7859996.1 sigma-70 family RNA polymerase sigma factor [Alteromonas sp. ASW11-36]